MTILISDEQSVRNQSDSKYTLGRKMSYRGSIDVKKGIETVWQLSGGKCLPCQIVTNLLAQCILTIQSALTHTSFGHHDHASTAAQKRLNSLVNSLKPPGARGLF